MTKSEFMNKLNLLQNKVADIRSTLDDVYDSMRRVESLLEDFPADESELVFDSEDEEDVKLPDDSHQR